jgi:hypothetical protein
MRIVIQVAKDAAMSDLIQAVAACFVATAEASCTANNDNNNNNNDKHTVLLDPSRLVIADVVDKGARIYKLYNPKVRIYKLYNPKVPKPNLNRNPNM